MPAQLAMKKNVECLVVQVDWDREFKVWSYAFSYSQLLLRSVPQFEGDLRVDVLFSNVRHLNIAVKFRHLSIVEADLALEGERLGIVQVPSEPFRLFLINAGPSYVLANQCQWHEDHEWVGAPSHFGPLRGVD